MSFISQLFGRRKKKDGGCPKCGFDLGGVSGVVSSSTIACPSCGTDISGHIDFYDLRDDHERRIEQEALRDLGGEDEKLAKEIVDLQSQREVRLHTSPAGHTQFQNSDSLTVAARKRIRRIGVAIGANGGDERMRRIAYRVQASGGSARQLEHSWSGICGWEA